jgi:uncharacterized delta-60 repeat protein
MGAPMGRIFGRFRVWSARSATLLAATALAALAFVPGASAAEGLPDPTFGSGGFTLLDEPEAKDEFLNDVIVLPDGKILAGGGKGGSSGFLLARFNANGTPDLSFGPNGISVVPFEGKPGQPRGINRIARQGDGKLIAAGLGAGATADAFAVARYLSSGQLDPEFGDAGLRVLEPEGPGEAQGLDPAPEGKTVVSGYRITGGTKYEPAVLRLTSEGDPDATFAAAPPVGFAHFKLPGTENAVARAVRALGDGSVIAGGESEAGAWLAKLDSEGKLDMGFGSGGFAIQNFGTPTEPAGEFEDLQIQPDGKIVAVGTAFVGGNDEQLVAARFTRGGDLDPSFGTGGVFTLNPTPSLDFATSMTILPDGRILIAGGRGVIQDSPNGDTWLVRLTANGQLDPSFGTGGQTTASASPGIDIAYGLAVQPNGRAVIAGEAPGPGTLEGPYQLLAGRFTGPEPVKVSVIPVSTKARCAGKNATIVGTQGADRLKGTKKADVIAGLGGNDRINALAGNDIVCGGKGKDVINGGPGKDRLLGEAGKDTLEGGNGKDQLSGGSGKDLCNGGAGKDAKAAGCETRKKLP